MIAMNSLRPISALRALQRQLISALLLGSMLVGIAVTSMAQTAPMSLATPSQLDALVQRIALYPDPLLAQTLTAATFWPDIPDAATWAVQHDYLTGDALAQAIQSDQLPWDPSVLGLLPFPGVLDMMARDPAWTYQLGMAVLNQRADVMDAVQRDRRIARDFGYLVSNAYVNVVSPGGYIEILPVSPSLLYVPVYNPVVVFAAPRPGFAIAAAIQFGSPVPIAPLFVAWGWWTGPAFVWQTHAILIGGVPWGRTWANRAVYLHAYPHAWVRAVGPRVERHDLRP